MAELFQAAGPSTSDPSHPGLLLGSWAGWQVKAPDGWHQHCPLHGIQLLRFHIGQEVDTTTIIHSYWHDAGTSLAAQT